MKRIRRPLRRRVYLHELNRVIAELNIARLQLNRYKRRTGYIFVRSVSRIKTVVRKYRKRSSDITKAELAALEEQKIALAAEIEVLGAEKDTTLSSFMSATADDLVKQQAERLAAAERERQERMAKAARDKQEAIEYKALMKKEASKLRYLHENKEFPAITGMTFFQNFKLKATRYNLATGSSKE